MSPPPPTPSIPPGQQRLRSGFPPKELLPELGDPSLPVNLANGERVSVDILASTESDVAMDTTSTREASDSDQADAERGKEDEVSVDGLCARERV